MGPSKIDKNYGFFYIYLLQNWISAKQSFLAIVRNFVSANLNDTTVSYFKKSLLLKLKVNYVFFYMSFLIGQNCKKNNICYVCVSIIIFFSNCFFFYFIRTDKIFKNSKYIFYLTIKNHVDLPCICINSTANKIPMKITKHLWFLLLNSICFLFLVNKRFIEIVNIPSEITFIQIIFILRLSLHVRSSVCCRSNLPHNKPMAFSSTESFLMSFICYYQENINK